MNGKFCGEAWDAISRYVYAALQGGSIMRKWTNDDRMMIACCNDGTRPVIFKIERIDIPENEEETRQKGVGGHRGFGIYGCDSGDHSDCPDTNAALIGRRIESTASNYTIRNTPVRILFWNI